MLKKLQEKGIETVPLWHMMETKRRASAKTELPAAIPEEVQEYVEPVDLGQLLGDLTLSRLNEIFQDVMKRQVDKIDPVRSKFGKIEKEEVTLSDKFTYIHSYLKGHKRFSFRQLLEKQGSRMHVVVTFLAILELMKQGEIQVRQEDTCGEIMIERTGDTDGD